MLVHHARSLCLHCSPSKTAANEVAGCWWAREPHPRPFDTPLLVSEEQGAEGGDERGKGRARGRPCLGDGRGWGKGGRARGRKALAIGRLSCRIGRFIPAGVLPFWPHHQGQPTRAFLFLGRRLNL